MEPSADCCVVVVVFVDHRPDAWVVNHQGKVTAVCRHALRSVVLSRNIEVAHGQPDHAVSWYRGIRFIF